MSLVKALPDRALDIVGDVHGEYIPLTNLMTHLGYDENGEHPENRLLIFVGDLFDRGPDSPAVFRLIKKLVENGRALAVLGNHEINLIRGEAKDGTGWFFKERFSKDQDRYAEFNTTDESEKTEIIEFLKTLPLALEREDIRVVHAAWISDSVARARTYKVEEILSALDVMEGEADRAAADFIDEMHKERIIWPHGFESKTMRPPLLHAHANHAAVKQMFNPIKVLTSGVERKGEHPFFSNGRWRFVERVRWWDEYEEKIPVVIGHYWRKAYEQTKEQIALEEDPEMFPMQHANVWHGKHKNVFCVDFSVGGKSHAQKMGRPDGDFHLAALRWPEKTLHFDNGSYLNTTQINRARIDSS